MTSALNEEGTGQYLSGDAFRLRMESQCREIVQYRKSQLCESGRDLSLDDAAREWIDRYAGDFAQYCEFSLN